MIRHVDEPRTSRAEFAYSLLTELSRIEGWALLKGVDTLCELTGDVDLMVAPASVTAVERVIGEFYEEHAIRGDMHLVCSGLRVVNLHFLRLSILGFGSRMLEVDVAEQIPFAGSPAITYPIVEPYLVRSSYGWWCSSAEFEHVLRVMYGARAGSVTTNVASILHVLMGGTVARLLLAGHPVLARLAASPRMLSKPSSVTNRVAARAHLRVCCVSPSRGGRQFDRGRNYAQPGHTIRIKP